MDTAAIVICTLIPVASIMFIYTLWTTGWKLPSSFEEAKKYGPVVIVVMAVIGIFIFKKTKKKPISNRDLVVTKLKEARDASIKNEQVITEKINTELDVEHDVSEAAHEESASHVINAGDHRAMADEARNLADSALNEADAIRAARNDKEVVP